MNLHQLIQNVQFKGIKNYKELEIDNLSNTSKEKNPNGIYFCLKGKLDGHDYANEAIDNGAVCLVVERFLDLPITQILVENARLAMSSISANFYEFDKSKIKFIGITGTNGKTTTAFIIKHILQGLNKSVGMIGTEGVYINNLALPAQLTTPDPIKLHKIIHDMDLNNIEYIVMEVSAHALALNKVDSIMYDVVGITNITQDHLDYFANMNNYASAKAKLFTYNHAKRAIINIDDKYTRAILRHSNIESKTLSVHSPADIMVEEDNFDMTGTKAIININDRNYMLNTNLVGEYNLANTLMAISICNELGFEVGDILSCLNNAKIFVPGRLNLIPLENRASAIIDFAHTPDGMYKVLSTLNKMKKGKLIVVFGCGGNRDNSKRHKMGEVATKFADYVIVTSDNPRFENPQQIISDILKGVNPNKTISIENRKDAIKYAVTLAKEDDIIAILGKGNEPYQEINGVKYPYNDYDVIKQMFTKEADLDI